MAKNEIDRSLLRTDQQCDLPVAVPIWPSSIDPIRPESVPPPLKWKKRAAQSEHTGAESMGTMNGPSDWGARSRGAGHLALTGPLVNAVVAHVPHVPAEDGDFLEYVGLDVNVVVFRIAGLQAQTVLVVIHAL